MSLIVKKFGGTSVGSIERIKQVAKIIAKDAQKGHQIVVAVSAMGNTTNELIDLAHQITQNPSRRELDMLLTVGERISMSLLSIALQELGWQSISFTGSQSGIITDNNHGNARIEDVKAFRLKNELQNGKIVIVAGFQGVSPQKEVTTLGRGGTDTTAVALAGYLNADKCEIYTDVDGIYSADPRKIKAIKLEKIDYERALFLAYSGAKIMHSRAVEFAQHYNIDVSVLSSFSDGKGTLITKEVDMEEKKVISITSKENLIKIKTSSLINNELFEFFDYEVNENLEEILVLEKSDFAHLDKYCEQKKIDLHILDNDLSAITIVGFRLSEDLNLTHKVITLLSESSIKILLIRKFDNGIRIYIKNNDVTAVVEMLHKELIRGTYDK